MTAQPERRVLHVFATFGHGGPQVRAAQLMARLGPGFRHAIAAMDGDFAAAALLPQGVPCELVRREVPLRPCWRSLRAAHRLLREQDPDLLLTYNWGAIETALAARWLGLRSFVHHEDGFLPDEGVRRKWRRNALRRCALATAHAVIVPSQRLLGIAQREWRLGSRALHLPNGVDLERFRPDPAPGGDAGARPFTIGTVGGLRPEKDHALLLRAFSRLRSRARLLLVGDGPLRRDLEALAQQLALGDRVEFAGAVADPAPCYRRMDAFALSSATEQMPLSLLEAMASALPVVATNVGDVAAILPEPCRSGIVPPGDEVRLAAALDGLARDPALRRRLGAHNRERCAEQFELGTCLDRFVAVYRRAARGTRE